MQIASVVLSLLSCLPAPAAAAPPAAAVPLPLQVPREQWRPLAQLQDDLLQRRLEVALRRNPTWSALIDRRKMAVGIVDYGEVSAPRFAQVNGETMMYGASLPKIAVLLTAFQGFEDGTLRDTPEVRADMVAMIRRSSNQAATRMIDRLGLRAIQGVILDPRYRFYDPQHGGGIWVGARYAHGGERRPDPIKGLSQAATVTQLCRFYYLLANGRLISPERSRQMLQVLSRPELHDEFVGVLEKVVPREHLYRKSGWWAAWHHDSVLVWSGDRRYILAAMIEDKRGEAILARLVPLAERLLGQGQGRLLTAASAPMVPSDPSPGSPAVSQREAGGPANR